MQSNSATLLIIDDDDVVRASIAAYLEDSGFKVLQANNGRVGLDVFRAESPDIILVDLRMPEMDGLEVLATVVREAPEVPIIVVSGTGMIQDAIEALRRDPLLSHIPILVITGYDVQAPGSADAVRQKPLDPAHLLAAIEGLLLPPV